MSDAVKYYSSNGVDVVAAAGEVDVLNIDNFRSKLAAKAGDSERLIVDLREVDYIDSAGLEQLVVAYARQKEHNKSFGILVEPGSQPDEVLHVVQIHTLTKVTSDPVEVGLDI